MGELNDRLGGRAPGELVRSADWNALVEATDALITRVDEGFAALTGRVAALESRVDTVQSAQASLREGLQRLSARHLDVALSSTRSRFAVGERAEIVARVTRLDGQPPEAPLPWIDFVTVWGRLSPISGPARAGAEGRTLSVQVDVNGEARVRLTAGVTTGVSLEVEEAFEVALGTRPPGSQATLAQTFLAANTPAESQAAGHFALATSSYLRASEPAVRAFADSYFLANPNIVAQPPPVISTGWRDYRSTVLAFAKPDPDPSTPDAALGVSALQVQFRDWLAPWIVVDVLSPSGVVTAGLADRIRNVVGGTFQASVGGVTDVVTELARERGLLGRLRLYREVETAVGQLQPSTRPPFLEQLKGTVTQALRVQEVLEPAQSAVFAGAGTAAGLTALTQTSVSALGGVQSVQARLETLDENLRAVDRAASEVSNRLQGVREDVRTLDGRVTAAVDRDLRGLSDRVATLDGKVGEVSRLYPEPVRETIVDFHDKLLKVDRLERQVQNLQQGGQQ